MSDNMPADVARAQGYVERVRHLATGPYEPMAAELDELAERLQALHLAALALDGWCPTRGAALTDPATSSISNQVVGTPPRCSRSAGGTISLSLLPVNGGPARETGPLRG